METKDKVSRFDIVVLLSRPTTFALYFAALFAATFLPLQERLRHSGATLSYLGKSIDWAQEQPKVWGFILQSYPFMLFGAGFICGWFLYQMLAAEALGQEAFLGIAADEVVLPPLPWDPNVLRLVIGLQHDPYSLQLKRNPRYLLLEGNAIFQNILIVGSIGSGKTAGVMYPLVKQIFHYRADDAEEKAGALILDVKGNFYRQVLEYAAASGRESDIIVLQLGGAANYNPLHKPEMEAVDLAERSRMVMDLFNTGNKKDAFWDTKAAQMMTECIRLLRCTTGYCSLGEVHKVITDPHYLRGLLSALRVQVEELQVLKQALLAADATALQECVRRTPALAYRAALELDLSLAPLLEGELSGDEREALQRLGLHIYLHTAWQAAIAMKEHTGRSPIGAGVSAKPGFWQMKAHSLDEAAINALLTYADFLGSVSPFDYQAISSYFSGEFISSAEATLESIKSCVTQMTAFFASSERIADAFCPPLDKLNFAGFEAVINEGKIVVLAMNVAEYPKVASTIAAYLKLDFQAEVQQRTSISRQLNRSRPLFFICDEYQEFVTGRDGNFYGVSRESRCCSIVASQSYTSLLKALGGDNPAFETLLQNLISKIVLHSVDKLTITTMQLITGMVERTHRSKNITESAASSKKSGLLGSLISDKAALSETVSLSTQRENLFEEKDFTQVLQRFTAIAFLAREGGMQAPTMIHLLPYYQEPIVSLKANL